jgi:hypothetical protein
VNSVNWDKWDHLLGKKPDAEIAPDVGCAAAAVWKRRRKLKIPSWKSRQEKMVSIQVNVLESQKTWVLREAGKFDVSVSEYMRFLIHEAMGQ